MAWTTVQRKRLETERDILRKYFPAFEWKNPTDSNNTKIEGYIKSNSGNLYKLRIYVPSDFPNSRPDMVVLSPYPLFGYAGTNMNALGVSAVMHTLSNVDGYVSICHYKNWLPNLTLYLVAMKGRIWIEAFEAHKRSGQPIDEFLSHMK